ncbi:MAG: helix-turn-helix domain-containing protein [Candidatus Acidiferrum sp.]
MPWKVSSVMEEKLRFILEYEAGEEPMTELCQRYDISRETGYLTLRRYRLLGSGGLLPQSHAALRHGNQTPEEIEQKVLELRQAHMRWGPRKLKHILERDEPGRNWPAANRRKQQQAQERFRREYNEVRPHEALGMQTPAAVYRPSARNYPSRVPEPQYPEGMLVRSVRPHGHFRWKQHDVFLSEVLWGENVGLLPDDDRWFTIYFAHLPLARFDSQRLRVTPLMKTGGSTTAGEGDASPSPATPHLGQNDQKLPGICPV